MMSFKELVLQTRSYRRFDQATPVSLDTLRELVDLARQTASGSNIQPLKYVLSAGPATNARIFPHTRWAGYLKDWPGPAEGERPAAYVVMLGDTRPVQDLARPGVGQAGGDGGAGTGRP